MASPVDGSPLRSDPSPLSWSQRRWQSEGGMGKKNDAGGHLPPRLFQVLHPRTGLATPNGMHRALEPAVGGPIDTGDLSR